MPRRSVSFRIACLASLAASSCLVGCATPGDPYGVTPAVELLARQDDVGDCMRHLKRFDASVDAAGLRDVQSARVLGYPFLRVDRFTAGWQPGAADSRGVAEARFDRMAALDAEGRRYEEANIAATAEVRATVADCRERLLATARPRAEEAVAVARVPDGYDDTLRVIGLYPLTKIPFSWGLAAWQQATRDLYATPFPDVQLEGRRIRYIPDTGTGAVTSEVAGVLAEGRSSSRSALQLPVLTPVRAWQLLQQHAPVLVVDTVDENDQVGTLLWQATGPLPRVGVDIGGPVAYVRVAWTVINHKPALQLVYTYWFPAHPASHLLDLAAGRLDALVWRVTLDSAGRPLVYDSIHACGCYHMFFPTERVRERPGPLEHEAALDETMFSPQVVHTPGAQERIIIYVGAHDHEIQRVAVDAPTPAPGVRYRLLDEDVLRSLPLPASAGGGWRSIYGPDSLVPGSERPERFVFWPMGIPSAGQMRQWGHYSTAFIGRRHFDDPRLIDRYFTLAPGAN